MHHKITSQKIVQCINGKKYDKIDMFNILSNGIDVF